MKKVKMILTNRFDPDVRVYKEAKYLVDNGLDVEILCWDRESEYSKIKESVIDGIKIKRFFPYSEYGTGFKQLRPFVRFINECKEYLKNKEYQYLHCHDLDGVIAGYFIKNNYTKFIFDMHENYEINGRNQKIRYIVRFMVNFFQNKSDFIIYVNETQKNFASNKNKRKFICIPNYPDIQNYAVCKKIKSDNLRVSYIGAVRQYNELKNLMDACKEMSNVKIAIHGAGVAYKQLNKIKDDYNNVVVTGRYEFTESAKFYSEADLLYVLYPTTSMQYTTSYPVKLYEAIVTKTPVIVGKGTVLNNFVNKYGIGFTVDGSNINEIRDLIEYLNNNRNVINEKIRNLEKIQYDYSWNDVVKNLDKIYG
ncbi:glycosyltransferase [Acidilutibacter cellobiosedens]|uniref:Glycosyltransferase n=1 Tax=Acidilutibacter cellobiosedens TaxID=2507161 RepID=A0A410QDP3_9FIRM|nr:glycosyltransferase [Acidilutibacter cellobiosedens]QAT62004.1 glycosyltransferase [Acidilutibacter cellobiosedens]